MAKFNKDTQYHFDKNKRRRRIAAAIILGAFGLAVAGHFIYKSCHKHHEDSQGIFEIKVEGEFTILVGFREGVTEQEIIEVLGDTLTIPSEINEIANNAFYRDGKSTIPNSITKIDFNDANLRLIGDEAFKEAKFNQPLTIPVTVATIGVGAFNKCPITKLTLSSVRTKIKGSDDPNNGAFGGNTNLSEIHLETWDRVDEDKFGPNVFASDEKNNGTIFVKDITLASSWKQYFTETHNFMFGENNWKMDPEALNIFDIREGVLYGFLEGIEDEDIEKAFPDGNMKIPCDGDKVTSVAENAFFKQEGTTTTIPSGITKITFTKPEEIESIGTRAFWDAESVTQININEMTHLTNIDNFAFARCEKLQYFANGDNKLCFPGITPTTPSSKIGNGAFYGCKAIEAIKLPQINNTFEIGDGAFFTDGTNFKTLDLSDLTINEISGEGDEREYVSGSLLNWMAFNQGLFCFKKPDEPHDQNKIILPQTGSSVTETREKAFLLAVDKQESSQNIHSGFHWLCYSTGQEVESLQYLINSWDLVEE